MNIGIKYCGGCNPRYDRTREVQRFITCFPQHTFTYTPEQTVCDVCLLVCGCQTACAESSGLAVKEIKTLCSPRDFTNCAAWLQNQTSAATAPLKKTLRIGDTASMTKTFSTADIADFARLTGDYGKLHTDAVFATAHGFGRTVVHGVLTGSLISSVMGMTLPGDGTILMDENLKFLLPVYAGDSITATVTLKHITERKRWYIGELYGVCHNQNNDMVVEGTCRQLLTKDLFTIM
jgi:acyl dehydratase